MYKLLVKPLLFAFNPERAHHISFALLRFAFSIPLISSILKRFFTFRDKRLEREFFGLRFTNPVGLAAGFDKDAKRIKEFGNLGFGFVEIGTLTPVAQPGNEKPRLFRLIQDEAVINRMGFNNEGVDAACIRLAKRKNTGLIVGGNIGKNKVTPNEEAVRDYEICFEKLFDVVDYFVVNVSSPNTPNLRELQDKEPLQKLLLHLVQLNNKKIKPKPILLKIAPDLSNEQLNDIIDLSKTTGINGLIATNTTISRENLTTSAQTLSSIGNGGLSGKPLAKRSTEVIAYLRKGLGSDFPIIGVGGIHSAADAIEKFKAGANLIQLYTGFVYEGPGLIKKINKALVNQS